MQSIDIERELKMSYDRKGRFYYRANDPKRKFYSVSTITKWGEPKIKANDAAKIGTLAHYQILRQLTDEFIEVPTDCPYWEDNEEVNQKIEDAISMFNQLELMDVVTDWMYVEQIVIWEGGIDGLQVGYAGRLDIIARFNDGKTRLLDLKTGDEYESYFMQMGGYVQAAEQCLGLHIDEVWILYLDIGGNFNKALGQYFKRNVNKIPRVVVMDRKKIDESIEEFNRKLVEVYEMT